MSAVLRMGSGKPEVSACRVNYACHSVLKNILFYDCEKLNESESDCWLEKSFGVIAKIHDPVTP